MRIIATVFKLSLEEGIFPLEWNEATLILLFKKKVRETIHIITDQ